MPRNSADRLRQRLLRHDHRLRADLAHLVAGDRGLRRRLCDLRRRSPGATTMSTRSRPRRSPASTAPIAPRAAGAGAMGGRVHERSTAADTADGACRSATMCAARTIGTRERPRVRSASSSATASGSSCSATSSCSRRSSPPTRCCRATRGRAERARAVRSRQRRDRDRLPAALELHLRHGGDRRRRAQQALVPGRPWLVTCVLGLAFLRSRSANSPISSRAGPGRHAAPSCPPSSRWSAAMACTSPPACCGC